MMNLLSTLFLCTTLTSAQLLAESWPNWIIPISSAEPNRAFGNQKSGHVGLLPSALSDGSIDIFATEIVFDFVPTSTGASYCTLAFTLSPTGPYTLLGDAARLTIYGIFDGFANETDTFSKHPPMTEIQLANVVIEDGQALVSSNPMSCDEEKVQIIIFPRLGSAFFDFTWFELNDPANGLFNGITFRQWK